jgi:hypothetical protein
MSVMFVGAIVALVFVVTALGGSRLSRQWVVGMYSLVDRSAARYRVFLPGEIEIGFGPVFWWASKEPTRERLSSIAHGFHPFQEDISWHNLRGMILFRFQI